MATLLILVAATLLTGPAFAFLPVGGFDSFGTLRFRKFPLAEFDNNNNGTVEPNEGLEILIETGPRGFTDEEVAKVRQAMQTWENVPSSYAAFGQISETQDIVQPGDADPDGLTSITLQVGELSALGENQEPDAVDDLTDGLLGITTTLYTLDDTIVPIGESSGVIVPAGTILDADIVINAFTHRVLVGQEIPQFELVATATNLVGLLLGLGFNPMNNLRQVVVGEDIETFTLVESEPIGYTDASGEQQRIGATPTMFPAYFQVEDFETGEFIGGWADLAPDDISGISWLYPRSGLESQFFSVSQEARTRRRTGSNLPSAPISGGHVVAWADVDNDPATPRIPLFNSLTGLFVPAQNDQLFGKFQLLGLWKQLEEPGTQGVKFNPTYSLSLNPFNGTGLSRQTPPADVGDTGASTWDSISGTSALLTLTTGSVATKTYDESFVSEVFNETENVTDISNKDAGTPLIWDFGRNQIVSADTDRTLPTILPNNRPMFGDPNDICPLNIISGTGTTGGTGGTGTGGTGTGGLGGLAKNDDHNQGLLFGLIDGGNGGGPNQLRWIRDNILLNTALGSMIVDTYYTYAPYAARFLLRHREAVAPARTLASVLYWVFANPLATAGMLAGAGLMLRALRRRSAARAAAALLIFLGLAAPGAQAQVRAVTDQTMVDQADLIVEGNVTKTTANWGIGGRIFTTVEFEVENRLKVPTESTEGEQVDEDGIIITPPPVPAIGDTMTFKVLGGQIGTVVMDATPLRRFKEGDRVLVYFLIKRDRWVVLNGSRGVLDIEETKDGEKFVKATSPYAEQGLAESLKKFEQTGKSNEDIYEPRLPLDFYRNYILGLLEHSGK